MLTSHPQQIGQDQSKRFKQKTRLGAEGGRVAAAVTTLAGLASIAVAVMFPASYFVGARDRAIGLVQARAEIYANHVADAVNGSPELWNAVFGDKIPNSTALAVPVPGDPGSATPERFTLLRRDGRTLLAMPPARPLAWPLIAVRVPVFMNGERIAEAEVERSLHDQTLTTFLVAAGSAILGLVLFLLLRLVPLRLMTEALERASFLSWHDVLTGLPNRALLADRLERALVLDGQTTPVAVICLDLDGFKKINENLGHSAGDLVLRSVAQRLKTCLNGADTLARLGGDEFAIIQPSLAQPIGAERLVKRLLGALNDPITVEGEQVHVGLNAGIALSASGLDPKELMKQADVALHEAKALGRGVYCFFADDMEANLRQRQKLESDLRTAFERRELSIYYQPQVDLSTNRIIGAEALMRWFRPDGSVPPSIFIPLAEEIGLIGPMGTWLLHECCEELARWPSDMKIAVNVSPRQLRQVGFLDRVRSCIKTSGIDAHRLELEVTEGILLDETEDTLKLLSGLRAMGIRLAIDDFGTGFASLNYLLRFRFDKIKIDRSFISSLGFDPTALAIVRAVIELTRALSMASNAEGVETRAQADLLRAYGCSEVQGFHLFRPMPAEVLRELLLAPVAA